MKRILFPALFAIILLASAVAQTSDDSGQGPLNPAPPKGISVDEIIQKFAAKEADFKQARENYTYRQTVKIQTLDGETVDGEYQQVSDILLREKRKPNQAG